MRTGIEVAQIAAQEAREAFPIKYSEMDCQAFVEHCTGMSNYAGSNDMFRNACRWVGTLAEAKNSGKMVPGALLFIHAYDGGEPSKYADGKGNASHVGIYCAGINGVEVSHSSSTKGMVCASTLKNAWTHVGLAKEVAYGTEITDNTADEVNTMAGLTGKTCRVINGILNMRSKQSKDSTLVCRVPDGATVLCATEGSTYSKIYYQGQDASTGKSGSYTGYGLTSCLLDVDVNADSSDDSGSDLAAWMTSVESRLRDLEEQVAKG